MEDTPLAPPPNELVIVVGSGNRHKVEEIASSLAGLGALRGRSLKVHGKDRLPQGKEPEESGATFAENARIKARAYAERAARAAPADRPLWILADDSGLEVDALGGKPGVLSARYSGPGATDASNNAKLLGELAGVPPERRGARFVCFLSLYRVPLEPEARAEEELWAEGSCGGQILDAPRGGEGFGYDPLFWVPGLGKTFAEISTEEKNELSHRGKALAQLRRGLESLLLTP